MSLFDKPLKDIHKRLAAGELTADDLVTESLNRINEIEDRIQAFLFVDEEGAREHARSIDEAREKGSRAFELLTALPAGIKDNICTEGVATTCASRMLANYKPIYNATVMEKLRAAQAISLGKLNMDEFAMGSSTETSAFKKTANPWDTARVPGGSSGGSAAAVAAREVYFSLGTDTGGSIRQPAAFCGVVGLKPTYGLVSRFGLVALASSLDQIGPITKNVEDAAYVLQAIAGYDPHDSTSAEAAIPDYTAALTGDIKNVRIGIPKQLLGEGINPQVKARIEAALDTLEQMGAVCEEVSLPHLEHAVASYFLIVAAEASSNLARYDGVRYGMREDGANDLLEMYKATRSKGFGREVKYRSVLGAYALSTENYDAYYKKAQQARALIKQDFDDVFKKVDVLAGPTSPIPAFKIGEGIDHPETEHLMDLCTVPVNLAGLPAISVPCGLADGLPAGLQIIGKPFDDAAVLRVAHAYEQQTDHHRQRPEM